MFQRRFGLAAMNKADGGGGRQLLHLLRRRWRVVALTVVLVTGLMTAYAEWLPPEYEATAVLAISPRARSGADAEMVRVGAAKYVAYATAGATERAIAPRLRERPDTLAANVDAEAPLNTGNVIITARLSSPERAAAAANAFAEAVGRFSVSDRLLTTQMVAQAVAPTAPSGPPRRLIELTAMLVGLMLGWGLAALREAWPQPAPRAARPVPPLPTTFAEVRRGGARTAGWQVSEYPTWGRIPWSSGLRSATDIGNIDDPGVLAATGELAGALQQAVGGNLQGTPVLLTSPARREGRTTVARLLCWAFTKAGHQVLLVEDRPEPNGEGGWAIAAPRPSGEDLESAVQAGPVPGLWILPSLSTGNGDRSSFDKLAGMLDQARERFDLIIVDGPPVLADYRVEMFSMLVDGVVLVFSNTTHSDALEQAIVRLAELPVPVLGVVGNGFVEAGDDVGSQPQPDAFTSYRRSSPQTAPRA
jgi:capsular polysaccharide biosynthesis protein